MLKQTQVLLWRALALLALVLAVIGLLLPVMPAVPFLLLAAWAAGKGWPALEARILSHPVYGPHIRDWRAHRAIPRKIKALASVMMLGSATMLWFAPLPPDLRWVAYVIIATLATICAWMWTRPDPPAVTVSVANADAAATATGPR